MKKFRVILPVEIDGFTLQYGQVVELDIDTDERYAHALIEEEGRSDGWHD